MMGKPVVTGTRITVESEVFGMLNPVIDTIPGKAAGAANTLWSARDLRQGIE